MRAGDGGRREGKREENWRKDQTRGLSAGVYPSRLATPQNKTPSLPLAITPACSPFPMGTRE